MFYRSCICFCFGPAVPHFIDRNHQFDFKVRKKVFVTHYILKWYYSSAGAYFSVVRFSCCASSIVMLIILYRMGRDLFRYGDETIWTPCHTVLDAGEACWFPIVFYLFMGSLAFGIIILGRRYVCTYIESICWYIYIILPSSSRRIWFDIRIYIAMRCLTAFFGCVWSHRLRSG